MPAKLMKKGCGENCRYRCHSKISGDERQKIFHSFWQLGSITRRRQFVEKYALKKVKESKRLGTSGRRKSSISWTLPKDGPENLVKVCKTFFLHTLSISDKAVCTVHNKLSCLGISSEDSRGKHRTRPNRMTEEQKQKVKQHIESFKTVESHYCRKHSSKQYLPAGLSVAKMHMLYKMNVRKLRIVLFP